MPKRANSMPKLEIFNSKIALKSVIFAFIVSLSCSMLALTPSSDSITKTIQEEMPALEIRKPRKIILCDIHEVLLGNPRFGKSVKAICKNIRMVRALKPIFKVLWRGKLDGVSGQLIKTSRKVNCPELKDILVRFEATTRSAYNDVIMRLRQLRDQDYELIIASNIADVSFQTFLDPGSKAHKRFPFFRELFTGIPGTIDPDNAQKAIRKPNPEYFTKLMLANNINPHTDQVFFIDDKQCNLDAAKDAGIPEENCILARSEKDLAGKLERQFSLDSIQDNKTCQPTIA